jgi:hypothetical protein
MRNAFTASHFESCDVPFGTKSSLSPFPFPTPVELTPSYSPSAGNVLSPCSIALTLVKPGRPHSSREFLDKPFPSGREWEKAALEWTLIIQDSVTG